MWYRVFGTNDREPAPAELLEFLHQLEPLARGSFRADERGWFEVAVTIPDDDDTLRLERFLAESDDIRAELNSWAAWLESVADSQPEAGRLMEHMLVTKQVFTIEVEDEEPDVERCFALCRYLAELTAGVYQVDGLGFFDSIGSPLVREEL